MPSPQKEERPDFETRAISFAVEQIRAYWDPLPVHAELPGKQVRKTTVHPTEFRSRTRTRSTCCESELSALVWRSGLCNRARGSGCWGVLVTANLKACRSPKVWANFRVAADHRCQKCSIIRGMNNLRCAGTRFFGRPFEPASPAINHVTPLLSNFQLSPVPCSPILNRKRAHSDLSEL
jgi:hypothetical protein